MQTQRTTHPVQTSPLPLRPSRSPPTVPDIGTGADQELIALKVQSAAEDGYGDEVLAVAAPALLRQLDELWVIIGGNDEGGRPVVSGCRSTPENLRRPANFCNLLDFCECAAELLLQGGSNADDELSEGLQALLTEVDGLGEGDAPLLLV